MPGQPLAVLRDPDEIAAGPCAGRRLRRSGPRSRARRSRRSPCAADGLPIRCRASASMTMCPPTRCRAPANRSMVAISARRARRSRHRDPAQLVLDRGGHRHREPSSVASTSVSCTARRYAPASRAGSCRSALSSAATSDSTRRAPMSRTYRCSPWGSGTESTSATTTSIRSPPRSRACSCSIRSSSSGEKSGSLAGLRHEIDRHDHRRPGRCDGPAQARAAAGAGSRS